MRNTKIINFLFIFITMFILLVFTACSNNNVSSSDTKAGESDTDVTANDAAQESEVQNLLPKNLDYGGEKINILNCMYFTATDDFIFNATELTGDIVNDAVYDRNITVQSTLNVEFALINKYVSGGDSTANIIKNSVMAGDKAFDMIIGIQYDVVPLVVSNNFYNLAGAPYLNIDKPWWSYDYIREMSIGKDRLYFLTGDITLGLIRNMSCMYFNKTFYDNLIGDPENMYDMVLGGKWTFDQFSDYSKTCYKDLNGDSKSNIADQFGCGVITANLTDHLTYDAGMRVTARDANDIPELVFNNEKTINFTQKMYSLYYENPGIYVFPADYNSLDIVIPNKFKSSELLFMLGWFYSSEQLRDMDIDYGLIPFPKYDERQETYLSLAHDISTLHCVPATCDKLEQVCAVMEALAFEGYKNVMPAYYEIAVKVKYARDSTDNAIQIIDMIHSNTTTDFAYIYNYALNSIGLIMRELMGSKKSDFVSAYVSKEKSVITKLNELIDVYTSLN